MLAHPPNIMAFAVTDRTFDPKTIPESYIMLREIKKIPYGDNFLKIEETAAKLSPQTPVLICENDCVIVIGDSLLNAFDRLEVVEFTAKSIIQSHDLGSIVHISEGEIKEIDRAFNLE